MAFILLGLFCVLFAENLVELEPTAASVDPTISCGALSSKGTAGSVCLQMPGCAFDGYGACVVDTCLNVSKNTDQAQAGGTPPYGLTCDAPVANFSWAHATNCAANDYVRKDTYAHSSTSVLLNRCSYIYLVNSTAPAPYCQLKPIPGAGDVPAGSNINVGTQVVGCETDLNGELNNICSCLGAWDIINADTANANCLSYPKCYVNAAGTCVKDTCVGEPPCAAGCAAVDVYKPVINGLTITGSEIKSICTNADLNKSPNKCFDLIYLNQTQSNLFCLNGLTPNKDQCDKTEECTTVSNKDLYNAYFRTEYFCTDKTHAPPGGAGFLIRVPSILVLLLVVFSFLF